MTQIIVTRMQVSAYISMDNFDKQNNLKSSLRKWFFDSVPYPLPEVGDFIDTTGGTYYVIGKDKESTDKVYDKQGTIVKIITRTFVQDSNGTWIVLISGTS